MKLYNTILKFTYMIFDTFIPKRIWNRTETTIDGLIFKVSVTIFIGATNEAAECDLITSNANAILNFLKSNTTIINKIRSVFPRLMMNYLIIESSNNSIRHILVIIIVESKQVTIYVKCLLYFGVKRKTNTADVIKVYIEITLKSAELQRSVSQVVQWSLPSQMLSTKHPRIANWPEILKIN
uniref:CSON011516 protein n=1 Tax=Culicoides sonorensis TaxID=179676 RepID=A0A336N1L5_CULSO